jgi:hypothetical protein
MSLTAHIGTTRSSSACVELRDGDTIVAKMYASPDEQLIRVVFLKLHDKWQAMISVENKLIEFSRSGEYPDSVHVRPAPAEVQCSVLGCERSASFIIRKIAYCEKHRRVAK